MPPERHLTGPDLIRLSESAGAPEAIPALRLDGAGDRAVAREATLTHLADCAICRARLEALRQQHAALTEAAHGLAEFEDAPEAPEQAEHLDALTERMMGRLRADLGWEERLAAAAGPELGESPPGVATVGVRSARARARLRWWLAGGTVSALAASIAVLLVARSGERPAGGGASSQPVSPIAATAPPPARTAPPAAATAPGRTPPPEPRQLAAGPKRPADRREPLPPLPEDAGGGEAARAVALPRTRALEEDPALFLATQQIEQLLQDYATAATAGDTARMRALFPGASRVALQADASARPVELALQSGSLARLPGGDLQGTVRRSTSRVDVLMYTFRRHGDGWIILRVQATAQPE